MLGQISSTGSNGTLKSVNMLKSNGQIKQRMKQTGKLKQT
jgi:hypothetical protein